MILALDAYVALESWFVLQDRLSTLSLFSSHSSIMRRLMRGALPLLLLSLSSSAAALLRGAEFPLLEDQVRGGLLFCLGCVVV